MELRAITKVNDRHLMLSDGVELFFYKFSAIAGDIYFFVLGGVGLNSKRIRYPVASDHKYLHVV